LSLTSISLYTGAGGLDLGLEAAGFSPRLCVEIDKNARATLAGNRGAWKLAEPGDIGELLRDGGLRSQAGVAQKEVTLLAGGPPCQPWSKSGYWAAGETKRLDDPRASTLRAYLAAVDELLPEVLLLENVRGLGYNGKDDGLRLVERELARINRRHGTEYSSVTLHLNAAEHGVPQVRERLFVVAHREGGRMEAPSPTHGPSGSGLRHYLTAWDALAEVEATVSPDLELTGKWARLIPSIPEGKNYLWHTSEGGGEPLFGWRTRYWSFLLKLAKAQPSWTIQATPGPATGPFHWDNRRLAIAELARLQTFPTGYKVSGTYRAAHQQVGNAVPPLLGEVLGLEIRRQLLGHSVGAPSCYVIVARDDCPPAARRRPVARSYLTLRGDHPPHPGAGLGPAARIRSALRVEAAGT
jgi:DNA (cytosine-5)-methyltransferase 1